MVDAVSELDDLIAQGYVPSSVERKKAILMYFFVGIVLALSQEKISIYEQFHLKQSIAWRMMFFLFMVVSLIFVFIPWFWIIPLLLFLFFALVWVVFVKQAREGKYVLQKDKVFFPFFVGIGGRVLDVFELAVYKKKE